MPEAAQNDILTSYLMFKVSLISWDHELGGESIQRLSRCAEGGQSQDMLYACIREAQQVGDKICTLVALKAIAESWDAGKAATSNLPCILRCAIRLIHLIEEQEVTSERPEQRVGFEEDLCRTFEKGMLALTLNWNM